MRIQGKRILFAAIAQVTKLFKAFILTLFSTKLG